MPVTGTGTTEPRAATLSQAWRRWLEPMTLVWVLVIAALLLLVAAPMLKLLVVSLESRTTGAFTFANYLTAYGRVRYVEALVNSLELAAAVAGYCLLFALPMAWAVSRTDMPGKPLIWLIVLGAFILPPYLGAVGWILLAGPNAGFVNVAWRWLTGAHAPLVNVYTFNGLALVIALQSFPLIFIFVKSALDLISSEMEDAANILGAGTWTAMRKITLPLVWPAILGGATVVFLEAVALFGPPAIIGIPARINVAATQLWQFFEFPVRVEVAAAYSIPLLLITLGLMGFQRRALGRKGFIAQSGKGGARRMIRLGPWRYVLLAWCIFVGLLAVAMPMLVLLEASFAKAWGNGLSLDNLTFANYRLLLFEQDTAIIAIWHTLWYSAAAASIAVVLALFIAYAGHRRLIPFAGALGFLAMAPFVIPGIVMAIGFYAVFAAPPLSLYGTAWILIFAFIARFLPIAYTNANAAMGSLHPEMEEAARILGCGRLATIRRITAPLLGRSLIGGWLIVFIVATRELSAAIFLVGPNTRTMAVLLYDLSEAGNFEVLAALGGILLAITFLLVGVGMRFAGRDFMLRSGT
ncbi:MAG TPA: iron ABC transporter permease [Acetobacteraceae bacterium]|jgi:iron(III) transport system permease protein|nr:iron ABC transporter permease [Acetobacteraceae bacterium]